MSTDCHDPAVTKEWLETALAEHYTKQNKTVAVTSLSCRPGCDATESVLSDILAVTAHCAVTEGTQTRDNTHNLILKMLPVEPFSRYFVAEAQFDLREVKFYTEIAPELEEFQRTHRKGDAPAISLPIPTCYFAKYFAVDLDTPPPTPSKVEETVIVLEDLKQCGYTNVSFNTGLTLEQTESALEAVSRLHALSLAIKISEKKTLTDRYQYLFQVDKASDSYQMLVERGLPQLTKFLEKRSGMSHVLGRLKDLRPHTKGLIEALLRPEEPMALITHTDFWCNNLLFRDGECAVLDWQMVACSRPTNDIALLLVSSVPTEIRRKSTAHLLDGYWNHLVQYCKQLGLDIETSLGYSRSRLAEDYRRSQLLALLLCIGSVDVAFGDPQTEQRLIDVLVDLHKDGVLSTNIIPTSHLNV